MFVITDHRHKD